ncbi:MAG: hypothetical protein FD173_1607 [Gallionellaceae bacterium]|nr:MAG: hypothetical protein FD173_1607 [Gallionellaceae bacterium]
MVIAPAVALLFLIGSEGKKMKTTHKLIQGLLVLAIAISTPHAFAADKTGEGASSTPKGEVVKTSKDGIKVHEVKGAGKMDSERKEKRAKEAKQK